MRALILVLISAANLLAAPAALAGIPGMLPPVLPSGELQAVLAVFILVNLLCLAVLLPDFDGTDDEDWRESDDQRHH